MTIGTKDNLKSGAKISLILLLLSIIGQFLSLYQNKYQLTSPLVPESIILDITRQYIFKAFVSTVISIAALILYFYEKYLLVIILVVVTLIASRFIYLIPSF